MAKNYRTDYCIGNCNSDSSCHDNYASLEEHEAILSGDFDPMTEEERREVYGNEHDRI